jgi:hypothetical protein
MQGLKISSLADRCGHELLNLCVALTIKIKTIYWRDKEKYV